MWIFRKRKKAEQEAINKRKVCSNCRNTYFDGDSYCRYCGAPLGTPTFIEEQIAVLYGPRPIKRTHRCRKCGYSWETCLMLDRENWCPKCGGRVTVTEAAESFGSLQGR